MRKYIIRGAFGLMVLLAVILLQKQFVGSEVVQRIAGSGGYFGVFVFSFLNSFNFLIPIVTATLTPTWVNAGLSFFIVVAVIVLAATLVDMGAYALGRYSRRAFHNHPSKILVRLEKLQKKSFILPLFLLGLWVLFVPLPNELITMPIGFLGYRILPVATIVAIGNAAFNGFVAYQAMQIIS